MGPLFLQEVVDDGIETEGSNLSGVSSRCSWEEMAGSDKTSSKAPYDDENKENQGVRHTASDRDSPRISHFGGFIFFLCMMAQERLVCLPSL